MQHKGVRQVCADALGSYGARLVKQVVDFVEKAAKQEEN